MAAVLFEEHIGDLAGTRAGIRVEPAYAGFELVF